MNGRCKKGDKNVIITMLKLVPFGSKVTASLKTIVVGFIRIGKKIWT